jgi:hypothetical protein
MEQTSIILEKLDKVLSFFVTSPSAKGYSNLELILKRLWEENILTPEGLEIQKILNKLAKDGYVDYRDHEVYEQTGAFAGKKVERVYSVTWEGIYFHDIGGYSQSFHEKRRLTNLETNVQKLNKRAYFFTLIIAIGTSIAAIYYLIEILKSLRWFKI